MTEANIKSVINEAIVKDNISKADMTNAILSQELRECIETVTKSLTEKQNTIEVISSIRRQVLDKKIRISLHQLLEIVKPEIRQDIINAIANTDIAKKQCVISVGSKSHCSAIKKKKRIHNYSLSSSSTESDSEYSSIDENEIRTQVLEAKKHN